MSLYIGLISGTSMDGIDAALVNITTGGLSVVDSLTYPYPAGLRARLVAAIDPAYTGSLHEFATLDMDVGHVFSTAALCLLKSTKTKPESVTAIGSHGQTLRHSANSKPAYSLQIGNGPTIAAQTKIDTVSDFRGIDIAAGGEGAPLVPAFHEWLFRVPGTNRVVLNIGGIANITILPAIPSIPISGFDTGPGNCLMDGWCHKHLGKPYDRNGEWGGTGLVSELLLEALCNDPYFARTAPKSTGREYFSADWLNSKLVEAGCTGLSGADVQASLLALTAVSISEQIIEQAPQTSEVFVCGGGAFNNALMALLQLKLPRAIVSSTENHGTDPEMIEAASFAWFAHQRMNNAPVKLTTRKATNALVLGALHIAPSGA